VKLKNNSSLIYESKNYMTKDEEGLSLVQEIIKNIELQELPLSSVALRCARLARLTNNQAAMNLFTYELAGYPKDDQGFILAEAFQLAKYANRGFKQKDKTGILQEYIFTETVAEIESELTAAQDQMKVAFDKDVAVSSANPYQNVFSPIGNTYERSGLRATITEKSKKINQLRAAYYNYTLGVYWELRLKDITEDIFQKRKLFVDKALSKYLPEAFGKFVSVYENLKSQNKEDWANAVHSCRRILKDVADFLYPADDKIIEVGQGKKIVLSDENYIVRLKEFVKKRQESPAFTKVVGSHLDYIGNRIDAIYKSSTKGSHAVVVQKEAEDYVVYTYMLVGDIMDLYESDTIKTPEQGTEEI